MVCPDQPYLPLMCPKAVLLATPSTTAAQPRRVPVRHATCKEAREHAASRANRQGEHLKRKVADCGSRHAAAGEEQAMPAARQPPQTASNELMPPPLSLPQPRKVADGAAVMPQRASG